MDDFDDDFDNSFHLTDHEQPEGYEEKSKLDPVPDHMLKLKASMLLSNRGKI
jgi:hypothetical protein